MYIMGALGKYMAADLLIHIYADGFLLLTFSKITAITLAF